MSKTTSFSCCIEQEKDVFHLVAITKQLASDAGFSLHDSHLLALAVSEMATNVIRYACNGSVSIQKTNNLKGLKVCIEDLGQGISDLELFMQDGMSSRGNSLGLGFGAAKRAVDELIINKSDSSGTSITLIKYLPLAVDEIDVGQVSFPIVGDPENKDRLLIKEYEGDKVLVAIFDYDRGDERSALVMKTLENMVLEHYQQGLEKINELLCDELAKKICRINLGCSILKLGPEFIEILCIGSTGIYGSTSSAKLNNQLVDDQKKQGARRLQTRLLTPDEYLFILHSDGVKGEQFDSSYQSSFSAQSIAMTVFDAHAISQDDASVIVIKGKKSNEATRVDY